MDSFKTYLEFISAGAFSNTAFGSSPDNPDYYTRHDLPTPTLDIPTNIVKSKIQQINYTENPITISLADGTVWKCSKPQWDYLKGIGREPKEGSNVQLEIYLDGTIKAVNIL
jgi:hypothetical protein